MESQSPLRGQDRSTDVGLRLAGLMLLALAWFAIATLVDRRAQAAGAAPDALAYGCATLGFVAGNLGAVLLALGAHVHDDVEISSRWARHPTSLPLMDDAGASDIGRAASPGYVTHPVSHVPTPTQAQR